MEPDISNVPLVGPPADQRGERAPNPWDVKTADGDPLSWLFLPEGAKERGFIRPDETREARQQLSKLIARDTAKVLQCRGKTREEALRILAEIDPSIIAGKREGRRAA